MKYLIIFLVICGNALADDSKFLSLRDEYVKCLDKHGRFYDCIQVAANLAKEMYKNEIQKQNKERIICNESGDACVVNFLVKPKSGVEAGVKLKFEDVPELDGEFCQLCSSDGLCIKVRCPNTQGSSFVTLENKYGK